MSSHHIVRDDQEPALLIVDPIASSDYLGQLLEWSPTVLVVQSAIDAVIELGIKIDIAICERSRQHWYEEKLQYQHPVKLILIDSEQHATLAAINFLSAANYPAVHLMINGGDELFDLLPTLAAMNFTFSNNRQRWVYCPLGHFKKWVLQDKKFIMQKHHEVSATPNAVIGNHSGPYREIKVVREGIIEISNEGLPFWLGEYID